MFKLRELIPCRIQRSCANRPSFIINRITSLACNPKEAFISDKTNINLLKLISETDNLKFGKAVHSQLIRTRQDDIVQTNYLINLYVKCNCFRAARHVFAMMPLRNVVSYSTLMKGYLHNGLPLEVLSVFKSMTTSQFLVPPNEYIFTTVLVSCSEIQALDEGRQCHAYVLKSGLISHSYVGNALLHMYSRCSGVEDALSVYMTLQAFDIYSFNSMINTFLEHGHLNDAAEVMKVMLHEIGEWDQISFVSILGLSCDLKNLILGCQIHSQIVKRGLENGVYGGSAIVDMYGKCGDVSSALHAFSGLTNRNVVSWTAAMAVVSQNGCFEDTLKLFLQMISCGVRPNEITYAVVLNSCAGLSDLGNGEALNALAEKSGCRKFLNIGNALINMYSKSGSIEEAEKVFVVMPQRDVISWNSMITGYSRHGLGKKVLEAFGALLKEGITPTYVTFVEVLSACGHLGLVEQGFYYLNFMRELGITPGVEHHTCILCILCRAGLLKEAENHIRCTNIEWDIVAWKSLLNGCLVHKNFGLGKKVARHILELDPSDVGAYILLSNIYAKESRWDGVADVRKLIRERCVKKEPGVSWIQVRSETHVFASEDNGHPLMGQIRKKLTDLIERIKLIGYVPDIGSVLHDVENEQKEEYLVYHSEKLALAFGLICTHRGSIIRIMKNLRVCTDCHTAMKLISNVTKRKIILRDANRFHCFEGGVCSCDDYW